ncbi:hypothetical protein B0H11DRAFT_1900565 [Mycena galericulata]|nr:hypothetical protein B0H11DRAFT_1900565 [Mycena galericulata]
MRPVHPNSPPPLRVRLSVHPTRPPPAASTQQQTRHYSMTRNCGEYGEIKIKWLHLWHSLPISPPSVPAPPRNSSQSKRLTHLSEAFIQIDWLYTELGMAPPDHTEQPRQRPVPDPESPRRRALRRLADFIEHAAHLPEDTPSRVEVEPTHALISWAMHLCAALEEMKCHREMYIHAMYDQLEGPLEASGRCRGGRGRVCRGASREHGGDGRQVRGQERMLELKRERIGTFVGSAREEIETLWDELIRRHDYGARERQRLGPPTNCLDVPIPMKHRH